MEKTKGPENDGQLLPDILRSRQKETERDGVGLFSAENHRDLLKKVKNKNIVLKDFA